MRMIASYKKRLNRYHISQSGELPSEILEAELLDVEYRAHILEGLMMTVDNIKDVVDIIRNADDNDEAKEKLMEKFSYSREQVGAILKMKLKKLTDMEKRKLINEYSELLEVIKYLRN